MTLCKVKSGLQKTHMNFEFLLSLHSSHITIHLGVITTFIYGPYFFKQHKAASHMMCKVTCQRYTTLMQQSVIPALLARRYLPIIVFMQDIAPPHIYLYMKRCSTIIFLQIGLPNPQHVIS